MLNEKKKRKSKEEEEIILNFWIERLEKFLVTNRNLITIFEVKEDGNKGLECTSNRDLDAAILQAIFKANQYTGASGIEDVLDFLSFMLI